MQLGPGHLSIDQAMSAARALGIDRRDAQVLLAHRLACNRSWLLAHGEGQLTPEQEQQFAADCQERARGVPVAYLVGQREFYGLLLRVSPDVLDPRPDTEVLVDWALDCLGGALALRPDPQVLDLGTGSGAIALAIKKSCPSSQVTAVERSAAALHIAKINTKQLGLTLSLAEGDWLNAVGGRQFDLIVSNPPYIASADPHLDALHAEPREALVAGSDGLDDLRSIVQNAPRHLRAGGALLLEHGADQAASVAQLMAQVGLVDIAHRLDLSGHRRCTGGWLPGNAANPCGEAATRD